MKALVGFYEMSLHVEEEMKKQKKKVFFWKNGTCEKARIMNFKKRNGSKDFFFIYTITVCVH
jgi:hypothetical protein